MTDKNTPPENPTDANISNNSAETQTELTQDDVEKGDIPIDTENAGTRDVTRYASPPSKKANQHDIFDLSAVDRPIVPKPKKKHTLTLNDFSDSAIGANDATDAHDHSESSIQPDENSGHNRKKFKGAIRHVVSDDGEVRFFGYVETEKKEHPQSKEAIRQKRYREKKKSGGLRLVRLHVHPDVVRAITEISESLNAAALAAKQQGVSLVDSFAALAEELNQRLLPPS